MAQYRSRFRCPRAYLLDCDDASSLLGLVAGRLFIPGWALHLYLVPGLPPACFAQQDRDRECAALFGFPIVT